MVLRPRLTQSQQQLWHAHRMHRACPFTHYMCCCTTTTAPRIEGSSSRAHQLRDIHTIIAVTASPKSSAAPASAWHLRSIITVIMISNGRSYRALRRFSTHGVRSRLSTCPRACLLCVCCHASHVARTRQRHGTLSCGLPAYGTQERPLAFYTWLTFEAILSWLNLQDPAPM